MFKTVRVINCVFGRVSLESLFVAFKVKFFFCLEILHISMIEWFYYLY